MVDAEDVTTMHYMHYVEGHTQAEVGRRFDVTDSTVNYHIKPIEEEIQAILEARPDATYYDARMEAYSSYERVNG